MQKVLSLNKSSIQNISKLNTYVSSQIKAQQNGLNPCQSCLNLKQQFQKQIFSLKDKAHQSFMQVIQVQQLNQQELAIMQADHHNQVTQLIQQTQKLKKEVQKLRELLKKSELQIKIMQKNSKQNVCDYDKHTQLIIDNIQIIQCPQQFQINKLDDSQLIQYFDIIQQKKINIISQKQISQRKLNKIHSQQQKHIDQQQRNKNLSTYTKLLQQRLQYTQSQLLIQKSQTNRLLSQNIEQKQQLLNLSSHNKLLKSNYQTLLKQSKFMNQHIHVIVAEKKKIQKKLKQLQKQLQFAHLKSQNTINYDTSPPKIRINHGLGMFQSQIYDKTDYANNTMSDASRTYIQSTLNLQELIIDKSHSTSFLLKQSVPQSIFGQAAQQQILKQSEPSFKKIRSILSPVNKNKARQSIQISRDQVYQLQKNILQNVKAQQEDLTRQIQQLVKKKQQKKIRQIRLSLSKSQNLPTSPILPIPMKKRVSNISHK